MNLWRSNFLIICLISVNSLEAQNLFRNPGFEEYDVCPEGYYSIEEGACKDWRCLAGSPDYFNCTRYQIDYITGVPSSGDGVVGMLGATNNKTCNGDITREWIGSNLLSPLKPCAYYRLTFDVSLAYAGQQSYLGSGHDCLDFGFYFYNGNNPSTCLNFCDCGNITPQVAVSTSQLELNEYVTFTVEFRVTGSFNKVMVGPFCNALTGTAACDSPDAEFDPYLLYYTLDNVLLEQITYDLAIPDSHFCEGDTIVLDATHPHAIEYLWQDGSTDPTHRVSTSGIYIVQVKTECETLRDTIVIEVTELPDANLGPDTLICTGETIVLDVNQPDANYLWQDGSDDPIYAVEGPGTYWVGIINECGYAADTLLVTELPDPVIALGADTIICTGDSIVLDASFSLAAYEWQDHSDDSAFIVYQGGEYWVRMLHPCGVVSDTISILALAPPAIELGMDTVICQGAQLLLDAYLPGATYAWQNQDTDPSLEVSAEGLYWVSVTNDCGTRVDSIAIFLENCACYLQVPNVFTPDYNGINDYFLPSFSCEPAEYHLAIFDRWGNMIFSAADRQLSWDGTYRGKAMPSGVYVYALSFRYKEGETQSANGNITLIR